ncbi:uncharacterized protein EAE97_005285 [Botrytis byssoidea]|uniref:Myb-like domain-containing protein n=1 Tax=Botrytis byssoidea TaxID=139641 RepID=A0A9P5INY9_9HELO|nr:uncharacterized protein EAE97_005285 [Botrytis byssoidea]KAF7944652.1 hypothetical protein EAE97_005285 [Botrytis byssoidea]
MSAANETPQLAAEAAPAAPTAKGKINEKFKAPSNKTSSGKQWTQAEKDAIVVQILFQAAGKSFVPNFKAIKAPGRTEKAVRHIWEALKKSHASFKEGNAKGEGVAKGNSKKRKAEIEGKNEGVAKKKKKNKVAKKTAAELEIEENLSDNAIFYDDSDSFGIASEDQAGALSDDYA